MSTKTTTLTSLSGAELRAMGTPEAQAEIARRIAKREASGKVTVAALRSWGRTAEADARVAAAKASKPAKKPAKDATPALTAFTHAVEEVATVAKGRDSIAKVRADFGGRIASLEGATLELAKVAAGHDEILRILTKAVTAKAK